MLHRLVVLNLARLQDQAGLKFQFYIHYPNHLIHQLGVKSVLDIPIARLTGNMDGDYNRQEYVVSNVRVLRKRPDANEPCNPHIQDIESELREEVIRNVGCTPIYWQTLVRQLRGFDLKICKTPAQLQQIKRLLDDRILVLNEMEKLCDEATVYVQDRTQKLFVPYQNRRFLSIKIYYAGQMYEEIVNRRDFGFEDGLPIVGGLMAFFLGYSLATLPDDITDLWKWISDNNFMMDV